MLKHLRALLLTALPLCAQGEADRHPLWDAATPLSLPTAPAQLATRLCLSADADYRITTADAERYAPFRERDEQPEKEEQIVLRGWRGERVSTQLVVSADGAAPQLRVSCTPLRQGGHATEVQPQVNMVLYTRAHGTPTADIISTETRCDNPAGVPRPVWLQVDIPRDMAPGSYTAEVLAEAAGCEPVRRVLQLEVQEEVLPAPQDWRIHVDFWQHPDAVARWHRVEPWSEAHFALMRPLMKRLAEAGQKVITCAIIDEAWNGQTYDWFPSQIRWVKTRGGMSYDFSVFDRWVAFMMQDIGVTEDIFCYTMVPWSMRIRYFDAETQEYGHLTLDPADASYERIWGHFLEHFRAHLREKGWLEKTAIALDERPDDLVRATKEILRRYAPELRVISSVNHPSEESRDIYLVSPILQHTGSISPELLAQRRAHGRKTIFYTCLSPKKPNSFTYSPPAESEWLGLFAAAHRLDGYSRWAYNSWNRDPFETTDFVHWPSGDCFLVYPGNLSSIRFERLRDGFEDYEKIRLLRERAGRVNSIRVQEAVKRLDAGLAALFTVERSAGDSHAEDVAAARRLIEETAAAMR